MLERQFVTQEDKEWIDLKLRCLESRFRIKIDKYEYYLSYSGGRDSHFLYWFIKEYLQDTTIPVVAVNTRMEHSDIKARIMENADIVLYPKLTPLEIKYKYEQNLLCCNEVKFYGLVIIGNIHDNPELLEGGEKNVSDEI